MVLATGVTNLEEVARQQRTVHAQSKLIPLSPYNPTLIKGN